MDALRFELCQFAAYATRFAPRHRKGNLFFLDGHVESKQGRLVVQTQGAFAGWANTDTQDIIWTADPVDDPNEQSD